MPDFCINDERGGRHYGSTQNVGSDGMTANDIGKVYSGTIKNAKMKKLITGRVLRNSNEVIAIYKVYDKDITKIKPLKVFKNIE